MKKLILIALTSIGLFACSSANNIERISTDVKGMVFNDLSATYVERPTKAYLIDYPDGSQSLEYVVEPYRMNTAGIALKIPSKHASEHLILLNKFLDWNKLAKSKNDNFSKEIGIVPTTNGYTIYTFHSSNKETTVLAACFTMTNSSGCGYDSVAFSVGNVEKIIKDVNNLASKSVKKVDTSIYK